MVWFLQRDRNKRKLFWRFSKTQSEIAEYLRFLYTCHLAEAVQVSVVASTNVNCTGALESDASQTHDQCPKTLVHRGSMSSKGHRAPTRLRCEYERMNEVSENFCPPLCVFFQIKLPFLSRLLCVYSYTPMYCLLHKLWPTEWLYLAHEADTKKSHWNHAVHITATNTRILCWYLCKSVKLI